MQYYRDGPNATHSELFKFKVKQQEVSLIIVIQKVLK